MRSRTSLFPLPSSCQGKLIFEVDLGDLARQRAGINTAQVAQDRNTQSLMGKPQQVGPEIGVKPFINAAAAYSALGGRNMWPEVVEAMEYARTRNVIMEELQDAVGRRLAQLIGCEAAMVTSGATSAMTLGTAAQ